MFGGAGVWADRLPEEQAERRLKSDDLSKLDGSYLVIGVEIGGKAAPQKEIDETPEANRTVHIENGRLLWKKGRKEERDENATFTIDPQKTPKEITFWENPNSASQYGIYKLEGDVLTICSAWEEVHRPKEFKTSKEAESQMIILKKK